VIFCLDHTVNEVQNLHLQCTWTRILQIVNVAYDKMC